jgi:DNA-binding LytR/AlgR family response regulator
VKKPATAVIAEDEPLLRAELRDMLNVVWPELEVCCEAADGLQAIEAFNRLAPDILFLDIQMPGANGLAVAEHASGRAHVVFVTAYDQYAIAAFEHGALDYVLKPLSVARIKRTVERLQQRIRQPPADLQGLVQLLKTMPSREPAYLKWLTVPVGSERRVLAVGEICYLRADNKYTSLATRSDTFLLSASLKQMREKLDPDVFWQIHRSILVNVGAIETIYRSFRGGLEIKLSERSETLPVSSAHAHLFKQF